MHPGIDKDLYWKLLRLVISQLLFALLARVSFARAVELDSSGLVATPEAIEAVTVRQSNESDVQIAKRVMQSYEETGIGSIADQRWSTLSIADARRIFEVTNVASFYTDDPLITADQAKALAALERLHASKPYDVIQTYRALLAARSFATAKQFFTRHSVDLDHPPPEIIEPYVIPAGIPSELRVTQGGARLVHEAARGDIGRVIIVVADPLCAYTLKAMVAIGQDPALTKLMQSHAKWIAPPSRQDDFSVFASWNSRYPQQRMSLAFRKTDWPMVTQWATPMFYFMDGGRVVETVAGWPAQGHKAELLAAARRIGIKLSENQSRKNVREKH
ncbi:hypothetical protein [Xanthomonas oryzae]|uniref:hypothetical protein n=1 Tax=Xanthomonas oryzae TaxID=347 RepID=UPI001A91783D|nr:hypothetical protein [Xanthomonas oryzae]